MCAGSAHPRLDPWTAGQTDVETFARAVVAAAPVYVAIVGTDLTLRYLNRGERTNPEEVVGTPLFEWIDEAARDAVTAALATARDAGETARVTFRTSAPEGEAELELFIAPLGEGARDGYCVVGSDVTEQLRRAHELEESVQKLAMAVEATGLGVWAWDLTTGEVEWSPQMLAMCGIEHALPLDEYIAQVVHPDDRHKLALAGEKTMETGRFHSEVHRVVHPDGQIRWMMALGRVLLDDSGRPRRIIGGNLDITRDRDLAEQLRVAQRHEAIGSLTAGIAHNFNNMLTAITPSLDLLEEVVPESHADLLEVARNAAERAAEMVRQLMTFAGKRGSVAREVEDLRQLAHRAVSMCSRTFDRHIAVRPPSEGAPLWIKAGPGDVEQVLVNLLLNARDALRVSPEVSRAEVSVDVGAGPDGSFVWARVRDNGAGMSEAVKQRIFEPFFTTKGPQGTGLGLATGYALARELGGELVVTSSPGQGAEFRLRLPRATAPQTRTPAEGAPGVASGAERVLLVDDEPTVRTVVERLLIRGGYQVRSASGVSDALRVADEQRDFDAVLLDISMPDGPGTRAIEPLRELLPRARILLFSGQAVDQKSMAMVDGIVVKPVSGPGLLRALARLD